MKDDVILVSCAPLKLTASLSGSPHCYKSRRVSCAKTEPESDVLMPLGLALIEKQITENTEKPEE
jgi:hypothetical protein